MQKKYCQQHKLFGTTTMGEKGQIVIPAEAREELNIKKGEKLLVFGIGEDMIAFSKLDNFEKFANHLSKQLSAMRGLVNKIDKK